MTSPRKAAQKGGPGSSRGEGHKLAMLRAGRTFDVDLPGVRTALTKAGVGFRLE